MEGADVPAEGGKENAPERPFNPGYVPSDLLSAGMTLSMFPVAARRLSVTGKVRPI